MALTRTRVPPSPHAQAVCADRHPPVASLLVGHGHGSPGTAPKCRAASSARAHAYLRKEERGDELWKGPCRVGSRTAPHFLPPRERHPSDQHPGPERGESVNI
jgi:hypothetical protein